MRTAKSLILVSSLLGVAILPSSAFAQKKPPYWASISAGQARMRTGPGREFPASWLFQRAGLPVKVLASYPNWRKVEDPEGIQGWIQGNLLSDDRTGMIKGTETAPLREAPNSSAATIWRAEVGVVGKLSECKRGWCKLDVRGRMGYVEASQLWGVDGAEAKP